MKMKADNPEKLKKAICIKQCDNQMCPSIDCFENNIYLVDIIANVYYYYVYNSDNNLIGAFDKHCFILLSEYREQQINEILGL